MAIKISSIKPNPNNPRLIKDERFKKLVKSIHEFPKMMDLRPIIVDSDNMILGGNMRLKALQELKYKEIPHEWVKSAESLTEEEKRRFIIADNVGFGDHDWDVLANEWDPEKLEEWGLETPFVADEETEDISDKIKSQFKIEIICKNESEQEKYYNKLIEEGYECRILSF